MYRNSFRLTNKEIDEAFAERQFRLVFQPKIDLAERTLVGVESFARWQHPQFGVIPPALFLPVLSRQGRNQELTRFVLSEAIAQLSRWRSGNETLSVSINVAPEELADGSLPVSIKLALSAANLNPRCLVIDLPERGLAAEPEHARDTINALSAIGVGLALECSQEPLIEFTDPESNLFDPGSFQEFKIGGRAIIQFASRIEGTGLGLMRSRLEYASSHQMRTTAVGAETAETVALLPSLGFDQAQGNAISAPLGAQALLDFDAGMALSQMADETSGGPGSKPELKDFQPPSTERQRPKPRIQVVRGSAKVELMTQGKHGTTTHVVKLPDPAAVTADQPYVGDTSAAAGSLLARLRTRLTGAFQP